MRLLWKGSHLMQMHFRQSRLILCCGILHSLSDLNPVPLALTLKIILFDVLGHAKEAATKYCHYEQFFCA